MMQIRLARRQTEDVAAVVTLMRNVTEQIDRVCLTEEDKQKFDGILLKAEAHLYAVQTFGSIV